MIHTKLLAFQKLQIALEKDSNNPHFNSQYVSLNEVLRKVKGPLNDMGIIIIQKSGTGMLNDHGLYTTLYDTEDDTEITSYLPYTDTSTAQKLGSSNTYNRRYALITLLGLEDNDDDGNVASTPAKPVTKPVAAPRASAKPVTAQENPPFEGNPFEKETSMDVNEIPDIKID